jgi:hypothetical protein
MRKLLWVALAVGAMGLSTAGCTLDDTYASCFDTEDCNDLDDQCFGLDLPSAGTSGNFCTRQCVDDLDCESNFGFGGVCYSFEAGPSPTFLCHQQCDFNSDCYSSSVCIDVTDSSGFVIDRVCVPDN